MMTKQDLQSQADGFQSDEEILQESTKDHPLLQLEEANQLSALSKSQLAPATQIPKTKMSLYPDMVTGWRPQIKLPNPIPLTFDDRFIQNITEIKGFNIIYLGACPSTSYYLHKNRPYPFPYPHLKDQTESDRYPFQGQAAGFQQLIFDAQFQGGNLETVVQFSKNQYDLFMRVDTNTRGHRQWYNFKVKSSSKTPVLFHIWGFKGKNLYQRGMRPYGLSNRGGGWRQVGSKLKFSRKSLTGRYKGNDRLFDQKIVYRLSFQYCFQENQTLQLCYCIPYTYSRVLRLVDSLGKMPFLTKSQLCLSLSGLEVPLIRITEDNKQKKKCVVISGRAHPGQSNGSFMMQGLIKFLTSEDRVAIRLRNLIDFRVIPMLNPDGVVSGNYRTGFSGKDFNRMFHDPDPQVFPQVFNLKLLVSRLKREYGKDLLMFLDLHGHSVKKNVFMYGPQFTITQKQYYESKVFPKLLAGVTPMFRFYSCIFRLSECKLTTARGVLMKKLNIPFCYTIEASNSVFFCNEQKKDIQFTQGSFVTMGRYVAQALGQYVQMVHSCQQAARIRLLNRQKKSKRRRFSQHFKEENPLQKIVQEIKKLQAEQQNMDKKSDDLISEGSSDSQRKSQDLDPEKQALLLSAIRSKSPKKNLIRKKSCVVREQSKIQPERSSPQQLSKTYYNFRNLKEQKQEKQKSKPLVFYKPTVSPISFPFSESLRAKETQRLIFANTVYVKQPLRRKGLHGLCQFRNFISPNPHKKMVALRTNSFILDQRI